MAEIIVPELFEKKEEGYAELFDQAVTNVSEQIN